MVEGERKCDNLSKAVIMLGLYTFNVMIRTNKCMQLRKEQLAHQRERMVGLSPFKDSLAVSYFVSISQLRLFWAARCCYD